MAKILVVEDAPEYQRLLTAVLHQDHELVCLSSAEHLREQVSQVEPDLILMDVLLPIGNGYEACQDLQANHTTRDIPIIFLTGKKELGDIQHGFNLGAEDYITKPFEPKELKVRVEARLRKIKERTDRSHFIKFGPIHLDLLHRTAKEERVKQLVELKLTPHEFQLLLLFCSHPNREISRREIGQHLSSEEEIETGSRVIDTYVSSLRKKSNFIQNHLESIYGVGYALRYTY